jgi:hypothetical protein
MSTHRKKQLIQPVGATVIFSLESAKAMNKDTN